MRLDQVARIMSHILIPLQEFLATHEISSLPRATSSFPSPSLIHGGCPPAAVVEDAHQMLRATFFPLCFYDHLVSQPSCSSPPWRDDVTCSPSHQRMLHGSAGGATSPGRPSSWCCKRRRSWPWGCCRKATAKPFLCAGIREMPGATTDAQTSYNR